MATKKATKPAKRSKPAKTATTTPSTENLPSRLRRFAVEEAAAVAGRCCWGLPNEDGKVRVDPVALGDRALFDDEDVTAEACDGWLPLAKLGKGRSPEFLVVRVAAPHGVGVWEHETGKATLVWDSLDAFIADLIGPKDKTPIEALAAVATKAEKLVDSDRNAEARALLVPAIAQVGRVPNQAECRERVGHAHNLLGLALRGLGKPDDANAAFARAADLGVTRAALNELSVLLEDLGAPRRVVERGAPLANKKSLEPYERVWLARYLAEAHLRLGEVAPAESVLRSALDRHQRRHPTIIEEVRAELTDFAKAGVTGSAEAQAMLEWFKPKSYEVSPEVAAQNRAWFNGLPEVIRTALGGPELSDADVARALETDSLWLSRAGILDVSVFLPFKELKVLIFDGWPPTLEPLRALTKLSMLRVNGKDVTDFKM